MDELPDAETTVAVLTRLVANLADRSRHWTSEDLAHALQIANEDHRRGRTRRPSCNAGRNAPHRARRTRDVPA
jgi:hypothetical protein